MNDSNHTRLTAGDKIVVAVAAKGSIEIFMAGSGNVAKHFAMPEAMARELRDKLDAVLGSTPAPQIGGRAADAVAGALSEASRAVSGSVA